MSVVLLNRMMQNFPNLYISFKSNGRFDVVAHYAGTYAITYIGNSPKRVWRQLVNLNKRGPRSTPDTIPYYV